MSFLFPSVFLELIIYTVILLIQALIINNPLRQIAGVPNACLYILHRFVDRGHIRPLDLWGRNQVYTASSTPGDTLNQEKFVPQFSRISNTDELEVDLNDCYKDNAMAMAAPGSLFAVAYTGILILPQIAVFKQLLNMFNSLKLKNTDIQNFPLYFSKFPLYNVRGLSKVDMHHQTFIFAFSSSVGSIFS